MVPLNGRKYGYSEASETCDNSCLFNVNTDRRRRSAGEKTIFVSFRAALTRTPQTKRNRSAQLFETRSTERVEF